VYFIFSEQIKKIGAEIEPWIIRRKGALDNFAPIFKESTPENIKSKYNEYVSLLKLEAMAK
jgi:hypothetical protein